MSHDRFRYGLIGAAFAVSALFLVRLPAILGRGVRPLGFNTLAKIETSFGLPAAALIIILIFKSLAKRDPFRMNYERFRRTYEIFLDLGIILVLCTHLILLGEFMILCRVRFGSWIFYVPTVLLGIVLIIAGNAMPRLRANSAMGIRTRWTLADETVWRKTHLASGYVLIVFGLTLIAWTFIDFQGIWWVIGPGAAITVLGSPLLSWAIAGRGRRAASPPPRP